MILRRQVDSKLWEFLMKALVFEKTGLENLQVRDIEKPIAGPHEVLIHVKMAGVNPIDYSVVNAMPNVKPMPHIPGAEFAGIIEEIGEHVSNLAKGDRVIVYNRVFDGSCDMCISSNEMLCRNGGIMSVITNGGYVEYAAIPATNAFRMPEGLSWEVAASLPVAALTPFHALKEAELKANENFLVFGASGNTGTFALQFGKKIGAKVIAISRKDWVKDFGADYVVNYQDAVAKIMELTSGTMVDVVLNSIGSETWPTALELLGLNGRLVFFGTLTGGNVSLALNKIYGKQVKILGTTGGNRKELHELLGVSKDLKLNVWKKFKLEDGAQALRALFSKERDGRILLET